MKRKTNNMKYGLTGIEPIIAKESCIQCKNPIGDQNIWGVVLTNHNKRDTGYVTLKFDDMTGSYYVGD